MTINPEFQVHKLNDFGLSKMQEIANVFDNAMNTIQNICPVNSVQNICPPGAREMSIARTKMEEACFFVKKGMAEYLSHTTPEE